MRFIFLFLLAVATSSVRAETDSKPGGYTGPGSSALKKISKMATPEKKSASSEDNPATPRPASAKKKSTKQKPTPKDEAAKPDSAENQPEAASPKKKTTPAKDAADEETGADSTEAKKSKTGKAAPDSAKKKTARTTDGGTTATASTTVEKAKSEAATPEASTNSDATAASSSEKSKSAPNASIEATDLAEFAEQPEAVQKLIWSGLELTKRNLTYTYGSADPANGGLDCSGTIYYLLRGAGFTDVPRDSSGQYVWARKADTFRAVVSKSGESFEFGDLLPGDLLFWSGTYQVQREIPITHVMLYLGKEKKSGKRVMFGASDGRSYNGVQRWGVSVFDFKMPRTEGSDGAASKVDLVGYARIPGLRTGEVSRKVASANVETTEKEESAAAEDVVEKPAKAASRQTSSTKKKRRSQN